MKQYSTSKISHHFSMMQNVTLSQAAPPLFASCLEEHVSAKHDSLPLGANAQNEKRWMNKWVDKASYSLDESHLK